MEIKCQECGEYYNALLGQRPSCHPPKKADDPPEVKNSPAPPRPPEKKCPKRTMVAKVFAGLRGLIFGASAEPGEQTRSTKTVRNEHTFSERDKLVAQKCAETALRVFTESLNIANKSKNLKTRESRLRVIRLLS